MIFGSLPSNSVARFHPAQGTWYDRSREYTLRRRGKDFTPEDHTQQETVTLTPLPCWRNLSPEDYRARIEDFVQIIVAEAEAERASTGKEPLGPEAIRRRRSTSDVAHNEGNVV
jgi:hypothetical protein